MNDFEESREIPQWLSWTLLVLLTAGIVTWCMFLMMMVMDEPRQWDFGTFEDVPAKSVYSTHPGVPPFDPVNTPQQMPRLPASGRSRDIPSAPAAVDPEPPEGKTP